ncbi:30S ribosomal protein S4 [Candidatus Wolfebacteria bacterium]|nr:30S ribosomal protein S4 [Candidatus Wolfebacteria bacterium]
MLKSREKKERALGVKLFLKGERCASPKCVMVRRPYRPGVHGKDRRRPLSEYGTQLLEKQRIRVTYGLKENQFENIFKSVLKQGGSLGNSIVRELERQFFNVVFRLGFASSRVVGRQLVNHGHFLINGKKTTSASYKLKIGDIISIKPASREFLLFKDLSNTIKKYEPPSWLELDKEKLEGRVKALPYDVELPFDINLVVDYYSK